MENKIPEPPKPPTPPAPRYVKDFGMPDIYVWVMAILLTLLVFLPVLRRIFQF